MWAVRLSEKFRRHHQQYHFWFEFTTVSGFYTVSVTAQLASNSIGYNWKLDMYDFNGANAWLPVGDLGDGKPPH